MAGNTLYFAYGSNINLNQMEHRCPDASVVGPVTLEGWELLFRRNRDECAFHQKMKKYESRCSLTLRRLSVEMYLESPPCRMFLICNSFSLIDKLTDFIISGLYGGFGDFLIRGNVHVL